MTTTTNAQPLVRGLIHVWNFDAAKQDAVLGALADCGELRPQNSDAILAALADFALPKDGHFDAWAYNVAASVWSANGDKACVLMLNVNYGESTYKFENDDDFRQAIRWLEDEDAAARNDNDKLCS